MRPSLRGITTAALAVALLTACSGGGEATYVPTAPPLDRTLAADEKATIAEGLAGIADMFGITDPPDVEIVRLTSAAGHDKALIDCMDAAGFPPTEPGKAGWYFTTAQMQAGMLAQYICQAQFPADPAQDYTNLSPEQVHFFYEYVTTTLLTCLKDHGVNLTADPPSEETFSKTYATDSWSPYKILPLQAEELYEQCPDAPPPELLWGK